jgi:chromosome segregation ATPase
MKNDKNAPAGDYHGDDGITGEYPVLFDPVRDATDSFEALNGTAPAGGAHDVTAVHEAAAALEATAAHDATVERPRLPAAEEVQVSGWLADLEAEIARLHDRWQQVEQGFTQKDGVIGELKTELAARDTALAEQRTRLESQAANLQTLERSLADKNGEIASLSAELTRRAAAQERDAAAMAGAACRRARGSASGRR